MAIKEKMTISFVKIWAIMIYNTHCSFLYDQDRDFQPIIHSNDNTESIKHINPCTNQIKISNSFIHYYL